VSWLAIRTFFGGVPRKVWIALAIAAAAGALIFLGVRWYHNKIEAADAAGYARAEQDIAAKAKALKDKVDALTLKITQRLKDKNNEAHRRIDADVRTVLVRGPGKASCPGYSSVPAKPGGYVSPSGQPGAAVDTVPNSGGIDLIALPFAGAVGLAELNDKCRADLLSYREWERQVREAWPKP
jgi:hypothetical protein